jgi:hypothetical protein
MVNPRKSKRKLYISRYSGSKVNIFIPKDRKRKEEKSDQSKTKRKWQTMNPIASGLASRHLFCDLSSKDLMQSCPYGLDRCNKGDCSWAHCAHCLWPSLCISSTFLATDLPASL